MVITDVCSLQAPPNSEEETKIPPESNDPSLVHPGNNRLHCLVVDVCFCLEVETSEASWSF